MVVRFFYRGQFTLLTQLIILNYPVIISHRRSTTVSLESVIQELWVAFKSERKSPWLEIDSQPLGLRGWFSVWLPLLYISIVIIFLLSILSSLLILFFVMRASWNCWTHGALAICLTESPLICRNLSSWIKFTKCFVVVYHANQGLAWISNGYMSDNSLCTD